MTDETFGDPENITGKYILDENNNPIPCPELLKWSQWVDDAARSGRRHVGDTRKYGIRVSTVFLGLSHSLGDPGPPVLFETMIFRDGECDDFQTRCCTWNEAVLMHEEACRIAFTDVEVQINDFLNECRKEVERGQADPS